MWKWFKRKFVRPIRPSHEEMVGLFYAQMERGESIHVFPWEEEAHRCAKVIFQIDQEIAAAKRPKPMNHRARTPGLP